jgi:surface polysaccharide O-acyltransferase-like enzyme
MLWMGLTALAMSDTAQFLPQLGSDISYALAGASGCFFMIAVFLRFGAARSRILGYLSHNAFGLYLFHYVFVVWLQYALLGLALIAIAKAAIVLAGTLILAWAATAALRFSRFGSRLIGEKPPGVGERHRGAGFSLMKGELGLERSQTAL